MVNINNRRNDIYPMFGGFKKDLVETARADSDVVLLPIHSDLTDREVSYIIKKVKDADKII
jgi:dTDP-4-amino-4,6-dideoxygalactose transaminase